MIVAAWPGDGGCTPRPAGRAVSADRGLRLTDSSQSCAARPAGRGACPLLHFRAFTDGSSMNGIASDSTTGSRDCPTTGSVRRTFMSRWRSQRSTRVRLAERAVDGAARRAAASRPNSRRGRERWGVFVVSASKARAVTAPAWPASCDAAATGSSPVNRADRRAATATTASPTGDAEAAARAVRRARPPHGAEVADGVVEMIRQLQVARRHRGRKAKTAAIARQAQWPSTGPRRSVSPSTELGDKALIKRRAAYRPGSIDTPTAAAKHALSSARAAMGCPRRRWSHGHDRELDRLTAQASPGLRDAFGIDRRLRPPNSAHRLRRQPRTAHPLRGRIRDNSAAPAPSPHHQRADQRPAPPLPRRAPPSRTPALYRVVIVPHALPPAQNHRLRHPPQRRRPHHERHHPLPQTCSTTR